MSLSQDLPRHSRGIYSPEEHIEMNVQDTIRFNFLRYGIHPVCADCRFHCKQYAAPGSTVICFKRRAR